MSYFAKIERKQRFGPVLERMHRMLRRAEWMVEESGGKDRYETAAGHLLALASKLREGAAELSPTGKIGIIYAVRVGPYVKIGRSRDLVSLKNRMGTMKNDCQQPRTRNRIWKLAGYMSAPPEMEAQLHERFQEKRAKPGRRQSGCGEFFVWDCEIEDALKEIGFEAPPWPIVSRRRRA